MKKVFGIILFFLAALFSLSPVLAADKEITCNTLGCTSPTSTAIFPTSEIWYPGKSLTKSIRVINQGVDPLTVSNISVNFSNTKGLDTVMDLRIVRLLDSSTIFFNTLNHFYSSGTIGLSTLGTLSSDEYLYTVTMRPEAGNEYQNASTKFDLQLNFSGGSPDENRSIGGVSGSSDSSSAPVCTAQTSSALTNLQVTGTTANTVTLVWNSVSPVTHYALIFTRLRDGEKYGSTNIGNVNTYTVRNLSGGESYEFEVFGVNDCAPGPAGKVIHLVTGGTVTGRPTGLDGEILGVDTLPEPAPLETVITSPTPSVMGDTNCQEPWWKTLFIIVTILLPIIVHGNINKKRWNKGFLTFTITGIAFIVDRLFFCAHSLWPLYIILSHIIASFIFQIYQPNKKKKNS
ncbi:MAG: hypothetical protein UW80_C0013G0014 [Microgenomates group bacterium GW2011_GWC1_44_9]|nr:MAG: hypothetical protein UW80_C0013G0014 [Microgenomates group bacterium GW2011_GWC1_44_9]